MSPEQARGSPIDRRSDVFALGIVLWELVTSQRLFKAENDLATIQRIINSEAEPPTKIRPDCPAELETIILKALAVDVAEAYRTAEELRLDLEELARGRKLVQSTVALRAYMNPRCSLRKIAAWKGAQASGVTLYTITSRRRPNAPGTPGSDAEPYLVEDDPDDFDLADDDTGAQPPDPRRVRASAAGADPRHDAVHPTDLAARRARADEPVTRRFIAVFRSERVSDRAAQVAIDRPEGQGRRAHQARDPRRGSRCSPCWRSSRSRSAAPRPRHLRRNRRRSSTNRPP